MRKFFIIAACLLSASAQAAIGQIDPIWTTSSPDTPDTWILAFCQEGDMVENLNNGNIYRQRNCAGSRFNELFISAASQALLSQTSNSAWRSTMFTGTTSQYVRGDGTSATLDKSAVGLGNVDNTADSSKAFAASQITSGTKTSAFISDFTSSARNAISVTGAGSYNSSTGVITVNTPASKSFAYSTRALNNCFQVSSSRDALVTYSVDIATTLSLTGGTTGTVYLRTYTNSSCTTGTQEVTRFVNGNTGTLTIGLNITQNVTGTLTGVIPAGNYVQLVTENTTGTPTFTARPGQETLF